MNKSKLLRNCRIRRKENAPREAQPEHKLVGGRTGVLQSKREPSHKKLDYRSHWDLTNGKYTKKENTNDA